MRMAMMSKITPPATSSERSDKRITCKKPWPPTMKAASTAKAMAASRNATRRRRAGSTRRSTAMVIGNPPSGSSTNNSKMSAEATVWSMGLEHRRACRAV